MASAVRPVVQAVCSSRTELPQRVYNGVTLRVQRTFTLTRHTMPLA